MIHAAAAAGADTAKFQLVRAAEILHPLSGTVDLPGGKLALYERFVELERDAEFYTELQAACTEAGLTFLCTPFGLESARMLHMMGVEEYKIASPELNHQPLLREIAQYRKPIILSTGVARLRDIAETLDYLEFLNVHAPIQLLHCVTSYPAREEEYNLRVLPTLHGIFGLPVGLSDHSMDPVLVPALATILDAVTIEKHITLDRTDNGLDDPIALDPDEFRQMVSEITRISDVLAEADDEVDYHRLQRMLEEDLRLRFGEERVEAVLGDGIKRLAPSELRHYGFTNRSIHVLSDLSAGDELTAERLAVLRSEKNLTPGLHPRYWEVVLGTRITSPVKAGEGLRWDHIIGPVTDGTG
ncbi:MAG: N-acetylneuraminate synthase family protein [Spirochaeta sp.]|nr:N-acetylneuraminate synthase family protein [Spirochaeta sp.]